MPDEQSQDFGAQLAQAREQRGLTLSEVSRRTKISVETLKAIERCEMAALPGGLYTRGFLRAYAREVGCDPDEIVRRYRERFKETDVAANAMAQLDSGVNLNCPPGQVHVKDIDAMTRRRSRTAWMTGFTVVIIGAAVHFMLTPTASWKIHRDTRSHQAPQPEASSTQSAPAAGANAPAPSVPTVGTAGSHDEHPNQPTDAPAQTLHLEVTPSGDCWLSATADGQRVIYRLLTAGDHAQVDAHDEVVLLVGDPATCSFNINGSEVRRLGAPGQPVTVRLTRDNFEQYLDRSGASRQD
jgi:transcriptional regulator with XRE-family HTH domain